jgi:hypothetical protein
MRFLSVFIILSSSVLFADQEINLIMKNIKKSHYNLTTLGVTYFQCEFSCSHFHSALSKMLIISNNIEKIDLIIT